jgi:hypothetical protein
VCSKAGAIIENKIVKVFAFLLQLTGVVGFSSLWSQLSKDAKNKSFGPIIGYPIVIIMLSIIWTDSFQTFIAQPRKCKENVHDSDKETEDYRGSSADVVSARFKSSR